MNYPENLKVGDTIGICAPSAGIDSPEKIEKLNMAINHLKQMGYNVIETRNVRKNNNGRSASAKQRAEEFMELLENEKIKLIIFATGGDFLCEMLDYLDFEKIKSLKPKWMQGYSDITGIGYIFNTLLEIPTVYSQTIKDYAMNPLHESLVYPLEIESGKNVVQKSFDLYEKEMLEDASLDAQYNLTEKVEWKNICGGEKIIMQGRALGGCLDCIQSYIGTKYDNVKNYLEKYKEDGFIWFLESFEVGTASLFRFLWQMKNAGYFKYCNGIVFGRPLFVRNDYDITYNETVKEVLGSLNIPIICDADLGHVSPQLTFINGAILKITSENGKATMETYLK